MNPHVFREYDIRGRVDTDLNGEFAWSLGRAFGSTLAEDGATEVAVGRDVRETSPDLAGRLMEGLAASGLQVWDLGEVPTPAVYFAVHAWSLDGGIQVTGSHNPIEYNGFKLLRESGSVYGEAIQALARRMNAGEFRSAPGSREARDVEPEYLDRMVEGVRPARPLKVVVDAGNGCGWKLGPAVLERLGCRVERLFCTPDGRFPHHIPDPTLPETLHTLRERVLATKADFGIAFDGDADRLGALDERGRVVWGDQLLALFAEPILEQTPGATVLYEVKCSRALEEHIRALGGKPEMTRTGHSLIKERLKETGAPLAGEMSGHLFFADRWFGFDDALYAAARLVELVAAGSATLGERVDALPKYHATPEIRIDCADDRKFEVVEAMAEQYRESHPVVEVDGARIEFPAGWGLVRASNTQPVLVLRAEGESEEARDTIEGELRDRLRKLGVSSA